MPEPLPVNDLPDVKPELVISSQILPDGTLAILLTRSIGALEASEDDDLYDLIEQVSVSDAVITISSRFGVDTLELVHSGVYTGTTLPFIIGEEYRLKVTSPMFGEATASTRVQSFINFDTVNAELFFNGFNDFYAQITYGIDDPPASNYYVLNVQEVTRDDVLDKLINPDAFTKILNDTEFDGQAFSEMFRVYTRNYMSGDSISVSIANVSHDYYEFIKLRIDNRLSFIEFLSEPINYPTNIQGGKGFFNLYIPDIRLMVL